MSEKFKLISSIFPQLAIYVAMYSWLWLLQLATLTDYTAYTATTVLTATVYVYVCVSFNFAGY